MSGVAKIVGGTRTTLVLAFAALLWLVASSAFGRALEIKGVVLTVSDLNRSVAFYETALGFSRVSGRLIADRSHEDVIGIPGTRVRSATLQLGDETIELEQYLGPTGQPIPVDSHSNDLWFQHFAVVVSDMDKAYEHLRRVPFQAISSAPQTIPESNQAAAGIRAFKFKDPDGHPLELLYFPPGKGNPKWQHATDRLFLGIDHSAITVSSSERSLDFYRDLLGLQVAGESLNTGTTQEQLDNAPGAVVRVTGLRPESADGPGLEFLHYVMPADGRSTPSGVRPNDIAHVRVVLEVDDIDRLADELTKKHDSFISPQVVSLSGTTFSKSLLVKDPDGHAVMLVQR